MAEEEEILDDAQSTPAGSPTGRSVMRGILICVLVVASGLAIRTVVTTDPYWKLTELDETPLVLEPPAELAAAETSDGEAWQISGAILAEGTEAGEVYLAEEPEPEPQPDPEILAEAPSDDAAERASTFGERPKSDVAEMAAVLTVEDETVWADAHIQAYTVEMAARAEQDLKVPATTRREVQRRLSLFGYDTYGIDGALGPKSRAAIAAWQTDYGFPRTGYLDEVVLASIRERTQVVWEEWQLAEAEKAKIRRATKTAPTEPEGPVLDNGCLRSTAGEILPDQGLGCGFRRTKEQLADFLGGEVDDGKVSLGRSDADR